MFWNPATNSPCYVRDELAIVDYFAPISQGAGTVTTPNWIKVGQPGKPTAYQFMALIQAGVMSASATLNAKIRQATDASGAGAKDVTGKAIAQMSQAGGNSGQIATIDVRAQDLDSANNFNFIQVSATVGTAAILLAIALLRMNGERDYTSLTEAAANSAAVNQQV
jgi:hypothetical protein